MRTIYIIIWRRRNVSDPDAADNYDTSDNYNTLEEATFEVGRTDASKWEFIKIVPIEIPDNR